MASGGMDSALGAAEDCGEDDKGAIRDWLFHMFRPRGVTVMYLHQVLVWQKPRHSALLFFAMHGLFWMLFKMMGVFRPYTFVASALLLLIALQSCIYNLWPHIRLNRWNTPACERQEEVQPVVSGLPELCDQLATWWHSRFIFLHNAKDFRLHNPGKFCILACSCCFGLASLGQHIPGIGVFYLMFLMLLLWPLAAHHGLGEKLCWKLQGVVYMLDYSGRPQLTMDGATTGNRRVFGHRLPYDSDDSDSEDELAPFCPELDAEAAAKALELSETEPSDDDSSYQDVLGLRVSRGTTPQLTDYSDGLCATGRRGERAGVRHCAPETPGTSCLHRCTTLWTTCLWLSTTYGPHGLGHGPSAGTGHEGPRSCWRTLVTGHRCHTELERHSQHSDLEDSLMRDLPEFPSVVPDNGGGGVIVDSDEEDTLGIPSLCDRPTRRKRTISSSSDERSYEDYDSDRDTIDLDLPFNGHRPTHRSEDLAWARHSRQEYTDTCDYDENFSDNLECLEEEDYKRGQEITKFPMADALTNDFVSAAINTVVRSTISALGTPGMGNGSDRVAGFEAEPPKPKRRPPTNSKGRFPRLGRKKQGPQQKSARSAKGTGVLRLTEAEEGFEVLDQSELERDETVDLSSLSVRREEKLHKSPGIFSRLLRRRR
uniref:reticulophagy regulator 3-like isoform X1 n=1 Tax=Myxine glutinosa TaxID=7769 RepID=UPI00358EC164